MYHNLSLSLTMAKGKRGYLLLLPLLSSLSLLPHCRPCLPLQPRCNDCRCHGHCLHHYRCRLPHFVDCCLPPQFLLLSATTVATVAAAATADPVSATVSTTVCPHCHCHCPCSPCTCPLCCPPAPSPSPLPTLLPSLFLAHHPCCHCSCRHCHHPLCCTKPSLQPCFGCHRHCCPPSAVATTTINANISTTVTGNAATTASIFTDACLCFCHYPHHRFCMCHSHHDCRFCHSCCHFLVDCCLTHHCHCSADAFANAATSRRAFASHLPGWLSRGFL
jgi:hypothetical protein